jgi:23S rRNA (adenine2503-C2)-methyltransferase
MRCQPRWKGEIRIMRNEMTPISESQALSHNHLLTKVKGFARSERYQSRSFDRQVAYRYLFRLSDGNVIETSGYQHYLEDRPVDYSIDISSMVGCPMKCKFCESALLTFDRALEAGEMVAQVVNLVDWHGDGFPRITCSFQGIGEASLIPEKILSVSRKLLAMDSRYEISIATLGERPHAFKIWRDSDIAIDSLQLSCSGTTDQQIKKMMPRGPKIQRLINELVLCSRSANINKVKLNYILMDGLNDSSDDVRRLIDMTQGTDIAVKVSSLNLTEAAHRAGLQQGSEDSAQRISTELRSAGIESYVYGPFNETNVSCGQLAFLAERDTCSIGT